MSESDDGAAPHARKRALRANRTQTARATESVAWKKMATKVFGFDESSSDESDDDDAYGSQKGGQKRRQQNSDRLY